MTRDVAGRASLSGAEVRQMLAQASVWLNRNAAAINAINVFPVPDGDTGSNMALTLDAAVEAASGAPGRAGDVLQVMAHGALMGARGNSGVILSQILRGLATGIAHAEQIDAPALAAALRVAAETAYRAVPDPIEGTILTVLRDVSTETRRLARPGLPLIDLLEAATEAARNSVARTPELLPVLKEAGVVDSGGLGLAVILEGCLHFLRGDELPAEPPVVAAVAKDHELPPARGQEQRAFGYCTEFLIEGKRLDAAAIKARVQEIGDSVLVVGEPNLVHVHVHTSDPGPALSLGVQLGSLLKIKVENMDVQHRALGEAHEPAATAAVSVIAIALGDGLEQVLREYGAIVVRGGQTMNPSTEEILRAIDGSTGTAVILLPNNKNVVWTAEQAAALAHKAARVLPSQTVPQGIAAMLAYRPDIGIEENASAMTDATTTVRTIEITRAARSVTINGIQAHEGQPIGLIDGNLEIAGETADEAALAALEQALTPASSAVTIYYGHALAGADAEALGAEAQRRWPAMDVQVISGDQPFYEYIIAVE